MVDFAFDGVELAAIVAGNILKRLVGIAGRDGSGVETGSHFELSALNHLNFKLVITCACS